MSDEADVEAVCASFVDFDFLAWEALECLCLRLLALLDILQIYTCDGGRPESME